YISRMLRTLRERKLVKIVLEPINRALFRHTDKVSNPLRVFQDISRMHEHVAPFCRGAEQAVRPVLHPDVEGIFQDDCLLAREILTDHPAGKYKGQTGPLIPFFPQVIDVGVCGEAAASAQSLIPHSKESITGVIERGVRLRLYLVLEGKQNLQESERGSGLARDPNASASQCLDRVLGVQHDTASFTGGSQTKP